MKNKILKLNIFELLYIGNKIVKQQKERYKEFLFNDGDDVELMGRLEPYIINDNEKPVSFSDVFCSWLSDFDRCGLYNTNDIFQSSDFFESFDEIKEDNLSRYIYEHDEYAYQTEEDILEAFKDDFEIKLSELHDELRDFNIFYDLKNEILSGLNPSELHLIEYDCDNRYFLLYEIGGFSFHQPIDGEEEYANLEFKNISADEIPVEILKKEYKQFSDCDLFEIIELLKFHNKEYFKNVA